MIPKKDGDGALGGGAPEQSPESFEKTEHPNAPAAFRNIGDSDHREPPGVIDAGAKKPDKPPDEFNHPRSFEGTGNPPVPALPDWQADETFHPTIADSRKINKQQPESVFHIEIEKIKPNPHQPRRHFDEDSLRELAASIREFGVIQPLVVSKVEHESESGTLVEYELIAGERRLMASKLLGLYTVPVIIRKPSLEREKLELAVIENVQRADLNPIETARAFAKLQDEFKLTQREIAAKLGKSREAISNSVRLLGLPSEIQAALAEGKLSESQARLLLGVPDIGKQKKIFDEIMRDNLSVRAIRLRVKGLSSAEMPEVAEIAVSMNPALTALKERLEEFFGTNIDLDQRGVGGKITINFYSPEELSVIVEKLLKQSDNQSPQSL